MKRYGQLYEKIISFQNILLASRKARKGKRFIRGTALFEVELEKNIFKIIQDLELKTYTPGEFRDFYIYDPKMRLISAAPYYDRVIHHAVMNIVEPLVSKSYIDDSYACITGRGTHKAVERYKKFQTSNQFVLKCDIQKYFQSIDHDILMEKLNHQIKCKDTLWLFKTIIQSRDYPGPLEYFDNDTLFTPVQCKKGIPIGNLTSQFFSNLYLNDFDHFMKEKIKVQHYIRYCDDFVVFSNDKARLADIKKSIIGYLDGLRLKVHKHKTRVFRVTDGVDFLGYRIWPDHTKIRKSVVKAYRKRLKRMGKAYEKGKLGLDRITASIQSWMGHVQHANSYGLKKEILSGIRLIKHLEA
ncbi:MAG: RNA-dependent DNA polymerase [Desulfobacterales bacterium RIFOXYA12_FULL_46_15]|nr:MAG: RNA-dependent DNA polymerase [Desulfobacterales bacterium RIFOXYA12_FULL_46_15]